MKQYKTGQNTSGLVFFLQTWHVLEVDNKLILIHRIIVRKRTFLVKYQTFSLISQDLVLERKISYQTQ